MTDRQSTHAPDCWGWGPKHYECAVREIERLSARLTAPTSAPVGVEAIREAFDEISGLCRHLRQGGPAPEDLQDLSDALDEAVGIAANMLHALSQQPVGVEEMQRRLDREESDHGRAIDQRDAAEDALGRMFKAVTGREAEWSSAWGYVDAIEEVEEHVAALAQQPAAGVGEEIMVKTPNDVLYILPLQPSGRSSGPRFVVHVPLVETPAVKALQAEIEALRAEVERLRDDGASAVRWAPGSAYWSEVLVELFGPDARKGIDVLEARWRKEIERAERLAEALKEIRSRSAMNLAMNPNPYELTALLGDIHQIAGAALAQEADRG